MALGCKPRPAETWLDQGNAFFNSGHYEEAIESFDKALQIKPDYHLGWYNRGLALMIFKGGHKECSS